MATASPALDRPLCVDLDGTLVKSDTLVDSLLLLVRTRPLEALKAPLWALKEKPTSSAKSRHGSLSTSSTCPTTARCSNI